MKLYRKDIMNITILGENSTALAAASYFDLQKIPYKLFVKDEGKKDVWNRSPLKVTGKIETSFYLSLMTSWKDAMDYGDILLICSHPADYEKMVEEAAPFFHEGQTLLFMNGYWGAIKAFRILSKMKVPAVTIAETAGMPWMAELSKDLKTLAFRSMEKETGYASIGDEKNLSDFLHRIFHKVSQVSTPAATSLSNIDPMLYVPASFFHLPAIEKGEDFLLFEGITEKMAAYMEACDSERLAIGRALSINLSVNLLGTLNASLKEKKDSLYEAIREDQDLMGMKGPKGLDTAYFTKDLYCGMAALRDLADMMHVEAPHIRSLVSTLSLYLGNPCLPYLTPKDLRAIKMVKSF